MKHWSIMEVRKDFMVSPAGDSEPTLRTAHFLKPIATSIDGTFSEIHSSSVYPMFQPKEWPLKVHFKGWHYPREKWVSWVDALRLRYEAVWKKVGIFEAIMSTRCHIMKDLDLAFGVVEKWCSETNTFVFPWGEATITLEDVMVLGGYPVLGDPVFTSLRNQEMREVEQNLILARKEFWRSRKAKAYAAVWISTFMNSGSEIEHEAFLATWLSVFVFPHECLVKKSLFPIAILLARGNPIALAPAVLASMYKDLNLLKKTMVDLTKNPVHGVNLHLKFELNLESPFYLVQIWAWERFKSLQPEPNLTNYEDHILFRWHKVRPIKIDNVRLALNSAMDYFLWRPYVRYGGTCRALYPENEIHIPFEADLDKELASFVTCMRVSELVGFDSTIMQYFPHRVAMQFGMDQDIPGFVPVFQGTRAIAWENYCRPISDRNLYFPSRLFEADVTTSYARWWKKLVLDDQDFAKRVVRRKRSARSSKHGPHVVKANINVYDADVPPGFPPKLVGTIKSFDDGSRSFKVEIDADVPPGFPPKLVSNESGVGTVKSFDDGSRSVKVENDAIAEADVTTSYARWWKQLVLDDQDFAKRVVRRKRSARSSKHGLHVVKANRIVYDADVPPGFPPKLVGTIKSYDDGSRRVKVENDTIADVPPGFPPKLVSNESGVGTVKSFDDGSRSVKVEIDAIADVPPGFPPKLVSNESGVGTVKSFDDGSRSVKVENDDAIAEADVTTSYARWWKPLVLDHQDFAKRVVRRKRSARSSKHVPHVVKANTSVYDADVPPGFPPKLVGTIKSFDDGSRRVKVENDTIADVPPGFPPKLVSNESGIGTVKLFDDGSRSVKVENDAIAEADVTTSYARSWKQFVLDDQDFAKRVVRRKRSARSSKHGPHVAKANRSVYDADVPPGFPPKLVGTIKSFDDGSRRVKVENDAIADVPPGFPPKLVSNESGASNGGVSLSGTRGESHICESEVNVVELKQRVGILEKVIKKAKIARFGRG